MGDYRMFYVKAVATRLIDGSSYPEIVLCEFTDFKGKKHEFAEKWPVISNEEFGNTFPKHCSIGCVIVEEKEKVYTVNTDQPWGIESIEGKTIFEVDKNMIVEMDV